MTKGSNDSVDWRTIENEDAVHHKYGGSNHTQETQRVDLSSDAISMEDPPPLPSEDCEAYHLRPSPAPAIEPLAY